MRGKTILVSRFVVVSGGITHFERWVFLFPEENISNIWKIESFIETKLYLVNVSPCNIYNQEKTSTQLSRRMLITIIF